MTRPLGTAIIDPPWDYQKASRQDRDSKLTGYSTDHEYPAIKTEELKELNIKELADYIFLWTTGPFIEHAYSLIRDWGFEPITFLAWVKTTHIKPGKEPPYQPGDDEVFKPSYGVGYWFRGCVEPIILAKRNNKPKLASIRTPWIGLLCPNAQHSRKPDTLHELIEEDFPKPYTELFARREKKGWDVSGNEIPGYEGEDIKDGINRILRKRK